MSLCINPECQKIHNLDTMIFCKGCRSELLLDGRYRAVEELGQGGFGTTYEVLDPRSHPWVLKVLIDNHPKYVELFKQEAQVLKVLDHPGIPKIAIDGYFLHQLENREEPLHCLVMEKIEGLNLRQYIKQRGNRPIKPKRALRWLAELALILEQVHGHNFFHRDIKPSNIMIRVDGSLALIDFGTAREVSQSYLQKMESGEVTGVVTRGYTPVEQITGHAVLQSDFYALGGTIIYLLTAQNPSNFYVPAEEKLIWRDAVPQIESNFADLIDRMMAFSLNQRPADSREILNEAIAIDSSLKVLNDNFSVNSGINSSIPDLKSSVSSVVNKVPPDSDWDSEVTSEFVERCRQELAECIGPMAKIICQRTIEKNPAIGTSELVNKLAKTIADPQTAKKFRQRLL